MEERFFILRENMVLLCPLFLYVDEAPPEPDAFEYLPEWDQDVEIRLN